MHPIRKKIAELSQASKALAEKYKKGISKADFGDNDGDECGCPDGLTLVLNDIVGAINSLQWQLDWISESFSDHLQGHLPPIKSTEQMQRAIDVLGLDSEYDVQKPVIYAGKGIFKVGIPR